MNRRNRRWTQQEEDRLLRQIKAFPQNLHKCFMLVSDEIGRSPQAISAYWYTKLSKKPGIEYVAFGTVTPKYFSKNRKNGEGEQISNTLWRRFLNMFRNFF